MFERKEGMRGERGRGEREREKRERERERESNSSEVMYLPACFVVNMKNSTNHNFCGSWWAC